jgi:hypothetical protein
MEVVDRMLATCSSGFLGRIPRVRWCRVELASLEAVILLDDSSTRDAILRETSIGVCCVATWREVAKVAAISMTQWL